MVSCLPVGFVERVLYPRETRFKKLIERYIDLDRDYAGIVEYL
jgi:hypothetical protein